jgi:hypothetical protein
MAWARLRQMGPWTNQPVRPRAGLIYRKVSYRFADIRYIVSAALENIGRIRYIRV